MNTLPTTLDALAASVRRPYLNSPTSGRPALPADVFPLESRTKAEVETAQTAWPQLDDSFLDSTYLDAKCGGQMPCFAVLSLFNPLATISVRVSALYSPEGPDYIESANRVEAGNHLSHIERKLNRALDTVGHALIARHQAQYSDGPWWSVRSNKRDLETYLTYRFTGLMPDRTRAIAASAKVEFGENLFLVCDAKESWVRTNTAPADMAFPKRDPLLIGAKVVHGVVTLFLLDKFDVTLAEDYLTREFVR